MSHDMLLLDTNIVSFLMKNDSRAQAYLKHIAGKVLHISFITVGELYFWAEDSGWSIRRRQDLDVRLRNYVIVPYDYEIAKHYAHVATHLKRSGRKRSLNDVWIAATALRHDIPLVTHNRKDFDNITGLTVISEV